MAWKTGTTKWKTKVTSKDGKAKSTGSKKTGRKYNVPEKASLTERVTQTGSDGNSFKVNNLYSKLNIQLADHNRAVQVAQGYQKYRITGVTMTFKPQTNVVGYGAGATLPYFYYMLDKSGAIPTNVTLESLKRMGAKPHKFTKEFTVKYQPHAVSPMSDNIGTSINAKSTKSPWLSTNKSLSSPGTFVPSDIDHLGIFWYVVEGSGGQSYDMDMTVNFEFKDPIWATELSETQAIEAVSARVDTSSDGIENDIP